MAHFVMSSLHSLLFVQIQDLRFWPVSTMVVLDVRKPKPGLARGRFVAFLPVGMVVVGSVEAVGCITSGWFVSASTFLSPDIGSFVFVSMTCSAI